MGWIIFAAIVLFFVLLGLARVRVDLKYDGELKLSLKYLFLSFPLSPAKVKKLRVRNYRIDRFRKMRIRERAKAIRKAEEKAKKDAEKKAKKEEAKKKREEEKKKAKETGTRPKKTEKTLKEKIGYILDLVKDVGLVFLGRFFGASRVEVKRLTLAVARGDAAETAETYGLVCAGVSNALAFLDSTMDLKMKDGALSVYPDFLAAKTAVEMHIVYSLRLGSILGMGIGAGIDYIKFMMHH